MLTELVQDYSTYTVHMSLLYCTHFANILKDKLCPLARSLNWGNAGLTVSPRHIIGVWETRPVSHLFQFTYRQRRTNPVSPPCWINCLLFLWTLCRGSARLIGAPLCAVCIERIPRPVHGDAVGLHGEAGGLQYQRPPPSRQDWQGLRRFRQKGK